MTPTRDPRAALIAWRKSVPYTQPEVAELFGVSKGAVGWWESARCRVPARVQALLRREGWLAHKRWYYWTAEHDTWLCAHAGQWPLRELAARLTAACGIPRSPAAVQARAYRLGLSTEPCALLTRDQISQLCGVDAQTVRHWACRGWLRIPSWTPRDRRTHWAIPPATLMTFVRDYAIHLRVERMPPSPYREIVAREWARAHWLSVEQLAAHLGVHRATVCRWIVRGQLPAARQHGRGQTAYWVRARDYAAFLKQREAA
jgi:excisionase family DNA binding protein